jgi:hypothetical protein
VEAIAEAPARETEPSANNFLEFMRAEQGVQALQTARAVFRAYEPIFAERPAECKRKVPTTEKSFPLYTAGLRVLWQAL